MPVDDVPVDDVPVDVSRGHRAVLAGCEAPRSVHFLHLREEVEIARERLPGASGRSSQVPGEQPRTVAQHAVIEQRRCRVEDDDVCCVRPQRVHEVRRQVRLVPERTGLDAGLVDVDGDVDVALAVSVPAGLRTEQIGLKDLCPGLQCSRQALHERPVDLSGVHVCIMQVSRGRSKLSYPPRDVFLRTGDAVHLLSAREHGLLEIYSNDRHLLAAAPHVGMRGRVVILCS